MLLGKEDLSCSIFSRPALKKKEQGRERARWRERREKRCGISAQPAARKREREKKKTPCHKSKAAPCSTVMDDRGASDAKKAPKGFFSLSLSFPSSVSRRNLRPFVSSPSSRWLRIGSVTQERRRRWEGYDDEGPSRETAAAKKMFEMISLKFLHLVLPKRQTSFALPPFRYSLHRDAIKANSNISSRSCFLRHSQRSLIIGPVTR